MLNVPDTEITEGQFNLLLDNFEGPIDLLLVLARSQKVDLSDISISELADQYINFINQYRNIHIEIAADYLDKKSLNNIDNEIQDFDFKNIDELDFTIQLYSNDNFENINKYLSSLLENKKEIIDYEDIFVFYKKTEIGTQYFITYKNYISKNNASEACDLLTIVKSCIILNLQN